MISDRMSPTVLRHVAKDAMRHGPSASARRHARSRQRTLTVLGPTWLLAVGRALWYAWHDLALGRRIRSPLAGGRAVDAFFGEFRPTCRWMIKMTSARTAPASGRADGNPCTGHRRARSDRAPRTRWRAGCTWW